MIPGARCAIRFVNGQVLVGELVEFRARDVIFKPWGLPARRIAKIEIVGASVLGPHSWAEAQEVKRRQIESAFFAAAAE